MCLMCKWLLFKQTSSSQCLCEYRDKNTWIREAVRRIPGIWLFGAVFALFLFVFFWWEQQRKVINYIFLSFPDSAFLDLLLPIFWSHLWLRHYTLRVGRAKIQDSILNIFLFWVILVKTNIWYEKRLKLQLKWVVRVLLLLSMSTNDRPSATFHTKEEEKLKF